MLLVVAACKGGSASSAPPRPEMIDVVRSLADRACACETDKACLHALRDEFDAEKADVLNHGLTGEQLGAFDTELRRLQACGDAGGLTFWLR